MARNKYQPYSTTCVECGKPFTYNRRISTTGFHKGSWKGRARLVCGTKCRTIRNKRLASERQQRNKKSNQQVTWLLDNPVELKQVEITSNRRTKHDIVAEIFAKLGVPMKQEYKPNVHGGVALTTKGYEALLSAVKVLTEPIADPNTLLWEIVDLIGDYNKATGGNLGLLDRPGE